MAWHYDTSKPEGPGRWVEDSEKDDADKWIGVHRELTPADRERLANG